MTIRLDADKLEEVFDNLVGDACLSPNRTPPGKVVGRSGNVFLIAVAATPQQLKEMGWPEDGGASWCDLSLNTDQKRG